MNLKDDYYHYLGSLLKKTSFREDLPSVEILYTVFSLDQAIEDMIFLQNIMGLNVNSSSLKNNKMPVYEPFSQNKIYIKYIYSKKHILPDERIYIYLGEDPLDADKSFLHRSSPDFYNELEELIFAKALKLTGIPDSQETLAYIEDYLSNMIDFEWSFDQSPYHQELKEEIFAEKKKFTAKDKDLLEKYNSLFYKSYPRNKEINDFNKREFSKAYPIIKELLEEEMEALSDKKEVLTLNKSGKVIVADVLLKKNTPIENLKFEIKDKNKRIRSNVNYYYLHYLYTVLKEKFSNIGSSINLENLEENDNELVLDISFSEYRTTIGHSNYYLYLLTNSVPIKMDYSSPLAKEQIKNWIRQRKFFRKWKSDLKQLLSVLENTNDEPTYFSLGISFALMFKNEKGYVTFLRQQRKHANVIEGYNVMPSTIYQTGSYFYNKLQDHLLTDSDIPLLMEDIKIDHFLIRELIREIFLGGGVRDFPFNIPSSLKSTEEDPVSPLLERDSIDYKVKDLDIYHRFIKSIEKSLPLKIIGLALDPLRLRPEIMVMVPIEDSTILGDLKKFEFDTKADFINLNEREIRYLNLNMDADFEQALIASGLPGKEGAKHYSGTGILTIEKSFDLLKKEGETHDQ
ncbi:MAG: hypothetical protein Q4G11_04575 [Gallicola sp.]|nr:hypothetical protein [Gallicola sp.]